uniref:Uncharacterized protein n=1 Tax=Trichobilharzia regenti TaxID=157069 RepID=A0AA85INZ6_TRIRE|nr:unnamed protein product [Trichobilharzia regenti]
MIYLLAITFLLLIHSLEATQLNITKIELPRLNLPYFEVNAIVGYWLSLALKVLNLGCVIGKIWDLTSGNMFVGIK